MTMTERHRDTHSSAIQEDPSPLSKLEARWGRPMLSQGFTVIPNLLLDLYADVGLKNSEAMFVIHLLSFKWTAENPYPCVETIAHKMDLSIRTIQRYSKRLQTLALKKDGDTFKLVELEKHLKPHCYAKDEELPETQAQDPIPYLVVTERFGSGRGQLSNSYDLSGLIQATLQVALSKGLIAESGMDELSFTQPQVSPHPLTAASLAPVTALSGESYQRNHTKTYQERDSITQKEASESVSCSHPMATRNDKGSEIRMVPPPPPVVSSQQRGRTVKYQKEQEPARELLSLQQAKPVQAAKALSGETSQEPTYRTALDYLEAELGFQSQQRFGRGSGHQNAEQRTLSGEGRAPQWQHAPQFIQELVRELAFSFDQLSDEKQLRASMTQLANIYQHAAIDEYAFNRFVQDALIKTRRATITKTTLDGRPNHFPYFFHCLEQLVGVKRRPVMM